MHATRPLLLCLAFAAFAACASAAHAATFMVDSSADAVDASPGDGVCEIAGGACTLRAALQEANALGGANTISLPAGTYALTLGELFISSNVTLHGAGATTTIIDAGQLSRVMGINPNAAGSPVAIDGVTFRNGSISGDAGGISIGGTGSVVNLSQVVVSGNSANAGSGQGGGIYVSGSDTLNLTDSTVSGNSCTNGGGGLRIVGGATANVLRSTISGNSTIGIGPAGGGIENQGTLTLANSTVSGNLAPEGTGSGISLESGTAATITNATIADNGAPEQLEVIAGTLSIGGTLVALPRSGAVNCSINAAATYTPLGNNLDSGTSCAFGAASINNAGSGAIGALADNGGSTRTHALLPGNAGIDAITEGCPPPATDQRGVPRPQGSGCDIGAFESDLLFSDGFE